MNQPATTKHKTALKFCTILRDRLNRYIEFIRKFSGRYPLRLTYSPRFKKILPQLMGVKGFEGIRIHSGNHHLHTEGCIIVGMSRDDHNVLDSGKAMLKLMPILRLQTEPIFIDVV